MSDPNIRPLLHGIWETWKKSGFAKYRPQSTVFIPESKPVQEAVLPHWGITALTVDGARSPDAALTSFLTDLKHRANTPHLQTKAAVIR
jgi:hypothetical protein